MSQTKYFVFRLGNYQLSNDNFHSSGDRRSRRTEQGGSTEMLCFQAVT